MKLYANSFTDKKTAGIHRQPDQITVDLREFIRAEVIKHLPALVKEELKGKK